LGGGNIGREADPIFRLAIKLARSGDRVRLLADPLFELPNAEGGEEQGLGSGQGAGGGHSVFAIAMAVGTVAWAARFFAGRLRFADRARGRARDGKVAGIHNCRIIASFHNI
jgi:hypothetical protein